MYKRGVKTYKSFFIVANQAQNVQSFPIWLYVYSESSLVTSKMFLSQNYTPDINKVILIAPCLEKQK